MLVGYLLKSKTPDGLLNTLAFVIFSIFGVYTLYQGLKLISASVCPLPVWPVLIAATAVFVVACVCLFVKREKKKENKNCAPHTHDFDEKCGAYFLCGKMKVYH